MPQKINPNIIRTCKVCGKEFHPTARKQACCNEVRTTNCIVCGKSMQVNCNTSAPQTCSKECASNLSKLHKEAQLRNELRKCEWCGKEFHPKTARDVYCDDEHFAVCVICGDKFKIDVRRDKTVKTCSKECRNILQLQHRNLELEHRHYVETMQNKYGVSNAMELSSSVDAIKRNNLTKYGTEWYTQTSEYKDKVKQTSLDKYGKLHFLQSSEVMDKRRQTCKERYGVSNFAHTMINNIELIENWRSFVSDGRQYIIDNYTDKPSRNQLTADLGVSYSSVSNIILKNNLAEYVNCSVSTMEDEVVDYLKSACPEIQIVRRCKSVITPYELDIYLPQYSIGIECNPTYTHNSTKGSFNSGPKSCSYHQKKTIMCEDKNIFLFHIFGYEWSHKKEIIKSMLCNLIGQNSTIIYARNCDVRCVDSKEAMRFLDNNHRQGRVGSKVKLGLYYNNELVSLMTFSMMRKTIGTGQDNLDNCWELVRFCNRCNTSVVGGASKLFKHFIREYCPERVRSFSDRAHTRGNLYSKLGFIEVRRSEPSYVWVDEITDQSLNRVSAQKSNLRSFFHDDSIDLSLSESQIMEDRGFVKVADSGTITWEYSNS